MTDALIIILTDELEELDLLEAILRERYEDRRRLRQALAIWGGIAVVSFLGIIAIIDRFVIR